MSKRTDEPESTEGEPEARPTAAEAAADHEVPGAVARPAGTEDLVNHGIDRGVILQHGLRTMAITSARLLVVGVAVAALLWLLGTFWVVILPAVLALVVSTVLWPPTRFLRAKKFPPALAAATTLVGFFGLIIGTFVAIAPSVVSQASELGATAAKGLTQLQKWIQGPPLNIDSKQLDDYTAKATDWLQGNGQNLLSSALSGVSLLTNGLVTLGLVLVLTFFFIKDGPGFLPWLRRLVGRSAGRHLTEVCTRSWNTLGGFVRAQAAVSGVDAVLIGIGLLILGVPLAIPLAILTFFGGFIPIVGALSVGALSVLVALVSGGPLLALYVLILIIGVQQLEGNVLSPILQGKSMQLHAGIILLAVTLGGALFGIAGAFLSVPVAAVLAVVIRYCSEQVNLRTGDLRAADLTMTTPEGLVAAERAERLAGEAATAQRGSVTSV